MSKFKVGDRVRVREDAPQKNREVGGVGWSDSMDKTIGATGTIENVGDRMIRVGFEAPISDWWYCAHDALDLVEPQAPEFKVGDRVYIPDLKKHGTVQVVGAVIVLPDDQGPEMYTCQPKDLEPPKPHPLEGVEPGDPVWVRRFESHGWALRVFVRPAGLEGALCQVNNTEEREFSWPIAKPFVRGERP